MNRLPDAREPLSGTPTNVARMLNCTAHMGDLHPLADNNRFFRHQDVITLTLFPMTERVQLLENAAQMIAQHKETTGCPNRPEVTLTALLIKPVTVKL